MIGLPPNRLMATGRASRFTLAERERVTDPCRGFRRHACTRGHFTRWPLTGTAGSRPRADRPRFPNSPELGKAVRNFA